LASFVILELINKLTFWGIYVKVLIQVVKRFFEIVPLFFFILASFAVPLRMLFPDVSTFLIQNTFKRQSFIHLHKLSRNTLHSNHSEMQYSSSLKLLPTGKWSGVQFIKKALTTISQLPVLSCLSAFILSSPYSSSGFLSVS